MKNIERKDWLTLAILLFVALTGEILFFYKQGNPMVDIGREFYIAERVSEGAVLYKDLFNIYGPLAYQINAGLFKIFGVHTDVLYIFGNIVGLCIISSIYVLARQFVPIFYSIIIALFAIFNGICRAGNFNYVVPYSFGLTYGLLAILVSLIFLVKYVNSPEKDRNLYLSAVFAGASVCFKYDYFPYLFVYAYVIWALKIYDWKKLLKLAGSFLVVPFVSIMPLFVGGLSLEHLNKTAILMKKIASAPSLLYFYRICGVFLTKELVKCSFVNLVSYLCVFVFLYKILLKLESRKKAYWAFVGLSTVVLVSISFFFSFIDRFLPLTIVLLAVFFAKRKEISKTDAVVIFTALIIALKTFFKSGFQMYCMLPSAFLVLASVIVLKNYLIKNEKILKTMLVMTMFALFVSQLTAEIKSFNKYQGNLKTERGLLTAGSLKSSEVYLIQTLEQITKKTDRVVILPEGHMINFLIGRKSDDMYNNFIPMYVEAFGEQNVIDHYAKNKPDYFVLSTRDTLEYGKEFICKDYAMDLCDWIFNNYALLYKISGEPEYYVLRKR